MLIKKPEAAKIVTFNFSILSRIFLSLIVNLISSYFAKTIKSRIHITKHSTAVTETNTIKINLKFFKLSLEITPNTKIKNVPIIVKTVPIVNRSPVRKLLMAGSHSSSSLKCFIIL